MIKIVDNLRVKDINGNILVMSPALKLYDTVNQFNIMADYGNDIAAFNKILENIETGRLIKAKD